MTIVRSLIAALALTACTAPAAVHSTMPTAPTSYRLCSDPQFEAMCTPAALEQPAAPAGPIRVDTNLKLPAAKRTAALG